MGIVDARTSPPDVHWHHVITASEDPAFDDGSRRTIPTVIVKRIETRTLSNR
jgi:hypothetical protein